MNEASTTRGFLTEYLDHVETLDHFLPLKYSSSFAFRTMEESLVLNGVLIHLEMNSWRIPSIVISKVNSVGFSLCEPKANGWTGRNRPTSEVIELLPPEAIRWRQLCSTFRTRLVRRFRRQTVVSHSFPRWAGGRDGFCRWPPWKVRWDRGQTENWRLRIESAYGSQPCSSRKMPLLVKNLHIWTSVCKHTSGIDAAPFLQSRRLSQGTPGLPARESRAGLVGRVAGDCMPRVLSKM